ncbi:MAG: Na+/H+ antiporter subunit E [Phenylobacterium sp.]|jgi:multicomponent K+:H+ antiporter subunit E|uniref:Na+/H+ antiporter subunit E n=1 Tax=Phenylobacterium sp. TaxID=1871053 RepID=UPI002A34FA84|nr:Na+/H+ antiporter subunit E [Phenylobacterium sp.]MDD3836724.1 Na+/H+ antiporter subunit E [Phenylobacterium sp.]MDX9998752.1 Na+/H+ antiporter subunit E [Phenylobacterium sp.]
MRRWLPHPTMSFVVLGVWLVLNQSLAVGNLLLGAFLGIGLGAAFGRLQPPPLRIRNRRIMAKLFVTVVGDVIRSNLALVRIILGGRTSKLTSGFVAIPLKLTDPYGLAVLACIITATPGTIWVSYRSAQGVLLIHVFDLIDEGEWIATITQRYERPLREIFE